MCVYLSTFLCVCVCELVIMCGVRFQCMCIGLCMRVLYIKKSGAFTCLSICVCVRLCMCVYMSACFVLMWMLCLCTFVRLCMYVYT